MKTLITHVTCFFVGGILSALATLQLAQLSSLAWQSSMKGRVAFEIQKNGARAALHQDWMGAEYAFSSSEAVRADLLPKKWDLTFPFYGWSISGLADGSDNTFYLANMSVVAYSLEKLGRVDEAGGVYDELQRRYPGKNREYFRQVAINTLDALDSK